MSEPIVMEWDGEALRPCGRFAQAKADKQYVIGERYGVEIHEERSSASHAHFFSCVNEVWKNLPDDLAQQFPSPEALRKRALILTGFRTERELVCSSKAEAQRLAAFLRPADEFALIVVHECTVIELKAKSQSMKAMGARDFYQSKEAVLAKLSEMIGVDVTTLRREAGMAA